MAGTVRGDIPIHIGLTAPRRRRRRGWVPPLMIASIVLLLAALWVALNFLGFPLPTGHGSFSNAHGPLMVLGFLGTVIALERAVALGSAWAYLSPAAAAAGGIAVAVDAPAGVGEALTTFGGVILVAIFVAVHRIQPSTHNTVLAMGAACWVVAGVLWLSGWHIPRFVPWLVGFLVLTITAERLELSRVGGSGRRGRRLFVAASGIFTIGLIVTLFAPDAGSRVMGVGLVAMSLWLGRWDIARRTIRTHGLTQYMAACLLAGYCWLFAGGVLWIVFGPPSGGGHAYDAMLHTVFLGFVISMIFAHAPVIFPSVMGKPLPYHRSFYVPLALLHVSLLFRVIGGDAMDNLPSWQWGGVTNEIALLLFIAVAAVAVLRARRRPATRGA